MTWIRSQAFLAGVVTLVWAAATAYVMLTPKLRNSITLLQFVSFYAIVLSHAVLWRELRIEDKSK